MATCANYTTTQCSTPAFRKTKQATYQSAQWPNAHSPPPQVPTRGVKQFYRPFAERSGFKSKYLGEIHANQTRLKLSRKARILRPYVMNSSKIVSDFDPIFIEQCFVKIIQTPELNNLQVLFLLNKMDFQTSKTMEQIMKWNK
ncbi:Hypothetical_protein [Hexamita inflata]|uniref:Hypothetical_protein n=1 Tax=Hexamita inflata TaxID=28002 RepID=A0AA86UYN1_9EUKA|nr:Hypothetical protein HINF_LOCUS57392 [Hexamita inflata]